VEELKTMHIKIKIILLSLTSIILLSACSQFDSDSEIALAFTDQSYAKSDPSSEALVVGQTADENASNNDSSSDMVAFNGVVFVATIDLDKYLWQIAGWRISEQYLDTENKDIPQDCTLYPHHGVSDQWVGSCSGYILVPRHGAKHIAVMVTDEKGSTNMVQVAP
jgi:hypothetical protein